MMVMVDNAEGKAGASSPRSIVRSLSGFAIRVCCVRVMGSFIVSLSSRYDRRIGFAFILKPSLPILVHFWEGTGTDPLEEGFVWDESVVVFCVAALLDECVDVLPLHLLAQVQEDVL